MNYFSVVSLTVPLVAMWTFVSPNFQAGEALGAIGSAEVLDVLREFANDPQIEVLPKPTNCWKK